MTDAQLQRDFGRMESQIKTLLEEVSKLRQEVSTLNNRFAALDGGRKALWGLLVAAGILGGIIGTFMSNFWPK